MENVENTVPAGVALGKTSKGGFLASLDICCEKIIVTAPVFFVTGKSTIYQLFCTSSLTRESVFESSGVSGAERRMFRVVLYFFEGRLRVFHRSACYFIVRFHVLHIFHNFSTGSALSLV
ncbi:MAG: hypothetical protein LBO07_03285 [Coriobacteriales bacterium]|nr:hypothetical protein [Coriobacteriales bacterium]